MSHEPTNVAADIAVLFVFFLNFCFFLFYRFLKYGKVPSLVLAFVVPSGWVFFALWDLGLFQPYRNGTVRWIGAGLGACLLISAITVEILELRARKIRKANGKPRSS
jgi:hypothetical protein